MDHYINAPSVVKSHHELRFFVCVCFFLTNYRQILYQLVFKSTSICLEAFRVKYEFLAALSFLALE